MDDHFRLSGHLQAPEVAPKPKPEPEPKPAPIQAAGLRTPEGYRQLARAEVWLDDATGRLVVLADPDDVWPAHVDDDSDHPHSCDAMGCGWQHVVGLGEIEGHTQPAPDVSTSPTLSERAVAFDRARLLVAVAQLEESCPNDHSSYEQGYREALEGVQAAITGEGGERG